MFLLPMVGSFIAKFISHRTEHSRREKSHPNCLQTECMDLQTELFEEQKKDEHRDEDTVNKQIENEVGNNSSEVHNLGAVKTSVKG